MENTETVVTGMESILGQSSNLTTLVGDIFTMITSNQYLAFMALAGLIFIAISVFSSLKHAAN